MVGKDKIEITAELKDLISGQFKEINNQVKDLENSISKLDKTGTNTSGNKGIMGSVLGANLLTQGIGMATGAIKDFGSQTIESLKNYEYFHASLKTMLNGNIYQTQALENQLVTLAKTTPFSLVEVQNSTKQLMAYGFKAGEVTNQIKILGDISAGTGNAIGDIAYLYGTLKTSGKVALIDMNQFAGRGIPIWETLAKRMNVTTGELRKMVSEGKIGFKDIEGAFKDMTSEGGKFFNLMADQADTVGGKISAFGDIWEQIRVNIGKSQTGIIGGTVEFMTNLSSKINDKLSAGNFMDEAFKSAGAKEYSGLTEFYGNLAGFKNIQAFSGSFNYMKEQAMYIQTLIEKSTTGAGAKESLQYINLNRERLLNKQKSGEVSNDDFVREMSLYNSAYKQIIGSLGLLKTKTEENKEDKISRPESKASDLEKVAKANRPTQVNINIENLVREYSNTFNTAAEALKMTPEAVAKVLISAVNDISNLKYT